MRTAIRILVGIVGAIAGTLIGAIFGLFVATLFGGGNDLAVAFLIMPTVPSGAILGAVFGSIFALLFFHWLRRFTKIGKAIAIVTAILVVSSGLAGMDWKIEQRDKPPPDQQLLTNYEKHEATLNQLVEMVKKDKGLTRVDTDWTDPHDPTTIGVSTERINEYRRLLREVRVPRGFSAWSQAEIDFLYWGIGSAVSDDVTKGYAYLESAPQNLAESLDGYKRPPTRDVVKVYRHIRGNWYLFYEYLPG